VIFISPCASMLTYVKQSESQPSVQRARRVWTTRVIFISPLCINADLCQAS